MRTSTSPRLRRGDVEERKAGWNQGCGDRSSALSFPSCPCLQVRCDPALNGAEAPFQPPTQLSLQTPHKLARMYWQVWYVSAPSFKESWEVTGEIKKSATKRSSWQCFYGSLDKKRVWRRLDICICMTKPLSCPPETITSLLIGYTPAQNRKLKKKKKKAYLRYEGRERQIYKEESMPKV